MKDGKEVNAVMLLVFVVTRVAGYGPIILGIKHTFQHDASVLCELREVTLLEERQRS